MSGRPHCKRTGKVRYRTEHDAGVVLQLLRERHHGERRHYECLWCLGWHLTSWLAADRPPHEEERMADIGEPRRTIEVEPMPTSEPIPEQVPTRPDREKVPA